MSFIIIALYLGSLFWVFLYSLGQLHLVWLYWTKGRKYKHRSILLEKEADYPFVTVQLPVYNELYVVENLLDAIALFDYPKHKFEVQVLDDSTDETVEIIAQKIKTLQEKGIDIQQIRRPERKGFKAGALQYGTALAKGEFIAIFDADFQPKPNFLKEVLPYFSQERIGMVQTRWQHINENYSLLTKLQALTLDAHFIIEHSARNSSGLFINFNGTAGIWRKSCIEDAGGWETDTLTEDLDLSYRAQLRNWDFVYVPSIESPAELPIEMSALRSQQFRWIKGPAECSRKNLGKVLGDKNIPLRKKIHACFHLLNSSIFIAVLLMSLSSIPMIFVMKDADYNLVWNISKAFMASFAFIAFFFWTAFQALKGISIKTSLLFLMRFPLLWIFSLGLALHNSVAAIEGFLGKKTPFVRTPKFNVKKGNDWKNNRYISLRLSPFAYFEALLALYFLFGILAAFYWDFYAFLPLHIGLFLGYSAVSGYSVLHILKR